MLIVLQDGVKEGSGCVDWRWHCAGQLVTRGGGKEGGGGGRESFERFRRAARRLYRSFSSLVTRLVRRPQISPTRKSTHTLSVITSRM